MDRPLFYINLGINDMYYTKAFINTSYLCFVTISASLSKRLRLPRISITPRDLT